MKYPQVKADQNQLQGWIRLGLIVALISTGILYEVLTQVWLVDFPKTIWITFDIFFLAGLGLALYLVIDRALRWDLERQDYQNQLESFAVRLDVANQRGELLLRVSQRLAATESERELVDELLTLVQELTGAEGVSFVPLDERSQPLPAQTSGKLPVLASEAWLEYLASPQVRQKCKACSQKESLIEANCPLLHETHMTGVGVYCVPLRRGGREYGLLNLYLPRAEMDEEILPEILRRIVDQGALALEGLRLRARELDTLRQLQATQARNDLDEQFILPLEYLRATLEADFVSLILIPEHRRLYPASRMVVGEIEKSDQAIIDGIVTGVMNSKEPVSLGEVRRGLEAGSGVRALAAVPLLVEANKLVGTLLAGSQEPGAFQSRHISLLETIANQVALVVSNTALLSELEFKTVMEERARLAREIHDGLAQTLGFLKLKFSQLEGFLQYEDYERLRTEFPPYYQTLAEAYEDARQAIDGLRISPGEGGIDSWLAQVAADFRENSGLEVAYNSFDAEVELAPEVQIQLIRIVQEALNNIRKHAQANQVRVTWRLDAADLVLDISDDGRGFSLEDAGGAAQHGINGMRERAELVGADFQIISHPGQGAVVRLRRPINLETQEL